MLSNINIEEVIKICSKRPHERTVPDICYLEDLTKSLKVFKNIIETNGPSSHFLCCKFLKYQYCEIGEYLFKLGDTGTRFYIIMEGIVGVEVQMTNPKGESHMVEVTSLNSGSSFGELALENNKPRAASIRCRTKSHFIYLEKSDYERLVSRMIIEKRASLVNFLQALPLFKGYTKGKLTKLTYIFREKTYNKGQYVYSEGEISEEIFIVKDGEFEIYKPIKKHQARTFADHHGVLKNKVKKVQNLGRGEIFGETEVFWDCKRVYSCKCSHGPSCVFAVNKIEFFKNVQDEETLELFRKQMAAKEKAIHKRVEILEKIEEDITSYNKNAEIHSIKAKTNIDNENLEIPVLNSTKASFGQSLHPIHKKHVSEIFLTKALPHNYRSGSQLPELNTLNQSQKKLPKPLIFISPTIKLRLNKNKYLPRPLNDKLFESEVHFNVYSFKH
ncbi:hypothetical protein SteCoe_9224 [Stentor coeruleus]|uniref:Cyclic nucleotide-binding domain-containing protein n=1 Tax=Stentor coeruleus TaxID=5963 RepID=A0A1R2CIE1_9CILI|nr:hypothetical protein SteCoe_9224 [Stentor coeruleus]